MNKPKDGLLMFKYFLIICAFLALSSNLNAATLERVVDGDTIVLKGGERVRLIGIDTPESKVNKKAQRDSKRSGQDVEIIVQMGKRATNYLNRIIDARGSKSIHIEYDVEKKDRYGRTLAYVYLDWPIKYKSEPDDMCFDVEKQQIFINCTMVKAGYATPMTIPPNVKYADLFQKLYKEARENKRGLWK